MFREGDAFFGGRAVHGSDHLWIIINEPALHDGTVLYVNITSSWAMAELTCVLEPGEHPFISRRSWVRYQSARATPASDLDKAERQGLITRTQPASPELVRKLRAGAAASPRFIEKLRLFL